MSKCEGDNLAHLLPKWLWLKSVSAATMPIPIALAVTSD